MSPIKTVKGKDDIVRLIEAFESNNNAILKLKEAYSHLEKRAYELTLELEKTNSELEKNLKEKEEVKNYLNNILESLSSGVMAVNLQGKVTIFNKAAQKITGYSLKDIKDKSYVDILGSAIFAKHPLTASLKDWSDQFDEETKILTKSKSYLPVDSSISRVADKSRRVLGFVVIFRDLSRLKSLEEQVKRTNMLTAMGEMALNIAHEIRNPLGSIQLFAEFLRDDLAQDQDKLRLVNNIIIGVRSLNHIISNLLLFTKEIHPSSRPIKVNTFIEETIIFTNHALRQTDVELIKEFYSEDLTVFADPELLKQVLLNLFLNAVQAMPQGGKLKIKTNALPIIKELRREDSMSNYLVGIHVSDTGIGIEKKDSDRVFNPFFTTKKSGTGLGLSIVHKIIEAHNGSISFTSQKDKGTVFKVMLPGFNSDSIV
ncbi:MAG: ATP-binding protein [bacterium]